MPYNTTAIPPRKEPTGQTQLPLSRVKKIVSQDPDVNMCSNNAAFVLTLAAELFIQHLSEQSHNQAKLDRKPRRNIQYKDVASAVSHHDHLEFLEDMVPKTIPFKKAKANAVATGAAPGGQNSKVTKGGSGTTAAAGSGGREETRPGTAGSVAAVEQIVNGMSASKRNGTSNGAGSEEEHGGGRDTSAIEEDPNDQLELEMRQAEREDVDMQD